MNPSQPFQPWLVPLGWLALEAALVVLAALAAQPLLRTAAARRSLWRAALLALIAVLALELTGTGSQLPAQLRLAWQTTFPAPVPPPEPPPALEELPFTPPPIFSLAPTGGEARREGAFPAPEPLQLEPASPLPPPPRTLSHPPTFSPAPSPLPAFLWLTGLATLLARSAWTHAGFAWLRLRHFLPAAESLCERVQALAARLGLRRRVRVLASERLRAPAAFGWMRPGVGVPGDFTARFAPAQQDVMLAHELAHLAARDPLWQLLADLAVAALWWHPLAWVARHQHRLAAELAADDASLALPDGPVVLAECLLVLGHEAAAAPRAPLGMAGFRSQLGRRVERLVALPRRDWSAPGPLRLALQTTTALLALAALALLPGCAANRTASEPPSRLVAKWWQAKSKTSETQPRGATLLIRRQPKPVTVEGRVRFNGTPPPEREIPLPPHVLAARTNASLKTRFHRISPDGGLADVLVYVKAGLPNQSFPAPTNTHSIRIQGYEYQPYITAVQTGQPIRWETDVNLNFHPTPTNPANREFNRTLMPGRPVEATFTAPEFFLRTKDDVHPWLFGYVSILPHPYFAVTDAEGRFRFPQPLPPGKYTLAAVHRRAGEVVQELNLTESLPAGARVTDVVFQFNAPPGSATPPPLISAPQLPAPPLAADFKPSKPPTREELLERKARVEADIKAMEKVFRPTHPKMVGLRKQLESVEEALRQLPSSPKPGASVTAPSPFADRGEKVAEGRLRGAATNADAANPSPQPSPLSAKREREQTPPIGDDVRSLTPTRSAETRTRNEEVSQSLITSSPTNAAPLHHQPTVEKLARIRLPEVTYDGLPLSEVLKFLQAGAKKFDPDKAGVDFEMQSTYTNTAFGGYETAPPELAGEVKAQSVGSGTVGVRPNANVPLPRTRVRQVVRTDMDTALVHLPTVLRDASVLDALDAIVKTANTPIGYTVETNRVVIHPRVPGREFVSPRVGTNAPGAALRALAEKIVFPAVIYDGLPLPEVIKFLTADARKHDPAGRGVNFLLTSHFPAPPDALAGPAAPLLDRLGNPIPHTPRPAHPDLGVVLVRFAPARQNLTLPQTLDAICAHADAGLQNGIGLTYRFEDYGVVITPKFPAPPAPKPGGGAAAPPAPAGNDVRSLTPTRNADGGTRNEEASQSLLTSAAANKVAAPDPLPVAQEEAVRRQVQREALERLLAEAKQFLRAKSWTNAVVRYEEAFTLAKGLGGPAGEKQSREALAGLTQCRLQLAVTLQEKFEFKAAAAEADKILPFDLRSAEAEQFKRFNERVANAHKVGLPKAPAVPADQALLNRRTEVMRLVRDGQLHYKMGEYQEARAKLEEAIAKDPLNEAAYYYLRLVSEAQFEKESKIETPPLAHPTNPPKAVQSLPVPNPYYRTNSQVPFLTHSSKGAQRINRKLEEIVLPEVHFDAVPLVGVVQRLIEDAKKFDPEKQGLNFLINDVAPAAPLLDAAGNPVPVARPVALSEGLVRVSQPLKNLTLRQALDVICKTAELPTQFSVEEYAIAFIPRGPVAYYSRMFRVNPDTFIQGFQGVGGNPVLGVTPGVGNAPGAAGQNQPTTTPAAPVRATVPATVPATQRTAADANALIRQFFQSAGVTALGATNGSTRVTFNPENGLLLVRGTTNDLRLIELAIQKVQPVGATVTNTVPQASPAARTNAPAQAPAHSSKGTQRNNAKLDEIILPEVRFDSVMLPEIVKWLDANARKFDPERKGLNFLINNVSYDPATMKIDVPMFDPNGKRISGPPSKLAKPDVETALVKLPVALTNLTLRQALDAVCKATTVRLSDGRSAGLKYSVEDYAIVFSPKLPEQAELFSRIFKVDPETFVRGLRSVTAGPIIAARTEQFRKAGGTNLTVELAELNVRMRDYLRSVGVSNLGPTNGPVGTQIYLNDQKGLLLVRASLEDLDIIQQAVELLNEKPAIKSPGAKRPQ